MEDDVKKVNGTWEGMPVNYPPPKGSGLPLNSSPD